MDDQPVFVEFDSENTDLSAEELAAVERYVQERLAEVAGLSNVSLVKPKVGSDG